MTDPRITIDMAAILQGLTVAVIVVGIRMLSTRLSSIRDQLARMNGRIGQLEEWKSTSIKLDDERHKRSEEAHLKTWATIDKMRERCNQALEAGVHRGTL